MFGIGMSEALIILAVALLVFGPQKLPEVAKQIAKGLRDLRRASDDLRSQVMIDLDEPPRKHLMKTADPPPVQHPPAVTPAPAEPPPSIEGSRVVDGAVAREDEEPSEAPRG